MASTLLASAYSALPSLDGVMASGSLQHHARGLAAPLAGSACYLGCVYGIYVLMARRPPLQVPKLLLLLYNLLQVAINAYVALVISGAVGGRVWGIGVPETPSVRYGVYLHYLCKYVDMVDTLIILLRKKSEQLSFLHLYHHSSICAVWGWVVHTWPTSEAGGTACYCYGAWVNAWVHVIMYGYYGLTSVGIRPPFKRLVTMVQLAQFFSCIFTAVLALLVDKTPVLYNAVQVLYHIGMLRLFLPLLLRKKGGAGAPPPQPTASAAGKSDNRRPSVAYSVASVPRTPAAADVVGKGVKAE